MWFAVHTPEGTDGGGVTISKKKKTFYWCNFENVKSYFGISFGVISKINTVFQICYKNVVAITVRLIRLNRSGKQHSILCYKRRLQLKTKTFTEN